MSKGVLRALFFGLLCFFLAVCVSVPPLRAKAAPASRAECVVEVSSRRILYEQNAQKPLPMASTTKVMTALVIAEDCDLSETVEIPKEAEGMEGSSVYLKAGERYTVEELLYGLMLRSGNDCATALALWHSGSVETFAQKMNERAALLGATDTRFVNPHGLPAEGHHTTARDLALISAAAMENPVFARVVSEKYYAPRGWKNKNKMLQSFEGAIGVKTGFTTEAGRCLVTGVEREGMRLVSVVLGSPEMYRRSAELLENAFRDYHTETLFDAANPFEGFVVKRSFSYPLAAGEREKLVYRTELCDPLPLRSGDFAGTVSISLENSLIFSQNLYMM